MAVRPLLSAPTMRSHILTATTIRTIVAAIAVSSVDAKTRSGFVLTVASSPPEQSLAPPSRLAKAITAGSTLLQMLNGAPCIVVLGTLHFNLVKPRPTTLLITEQILSDRQSSLVSGSNPFLEIWRI